MSIESLKEVVADLLDAEPEELALDTSFNQKCDFDSLKVVLLMAALEEDFNMNVPPAKAWEFNSIQDILDFADECGVSFVE